MVNNEKVKNDDYCTISSLRYTLVKFHIDECRRSNKEPHPIYLEFIKNLKIDKDKKGITQHMIQPYYLKELEQQRLREEQERLDKERDEILLHNENLKKKKTIFNRIYKYISKCIDAFRI